MIGVDTNVLVRYLVQDHPQQASQATRVLEQSCTRETPGRVALMVLCELVWVLRRAYGYEKSVVVEVLERLLMTDALAIEQEDLAWKALGSFKAGAADFADYVIVHANEQAGCEHTVTFDSKLAQHPLAQAVA